MARWVSRPALHSLEGIRTCPAPFGGYPYLPYTIWRVSGPALHSSEGIHTCPAQFGGYPDLPCTVRRVSGPALHSSEGIRTCPAQFGGYPDLPCTVRRVSGPALLSSGPAARYRRLIHTCQQRVKLPVNTPAPRLREGETRRGTPHASRVTRRRRQALNNFHVKRTAQVASAMSLVFRALFLLGSREFVRG